MSRYYISPPVMSPFGRIIAGVVAVLSVIGAFIFGIFVLGLAIGLAVILVVVASIRNWWMRRKEGARPSGDDQKRHETIEAEYTVISRRHD